MANTMAKAKESEMDKAYAMIRINFPRVTRLEFEKTILAALQPGETLKQCTVRLVRTQLKGY